jgi:hypothetical protein
MLSSGKEVNNLPYESAGLAGSRRVYSLKVIPFQTSVTKQKRRRAYRRKRSARSRIPSMKYGPPAVEPRSIISPSSSFTDCESDFSDNFFFTSS